MITFAGATLLSFSLFFTDAELSKRDQETAQIEGDVYRPMNLKGIVYFGPEDWTLWIDDFKFTSDTLNHNGYEILNVSDDRVQLRVNGQERTLFVKNSL